MSRTAYYNSNDGTALLMVGSEHELRVNRIPAIDLIDDFINQYRGEYITVLLSYDLKNEIEELYSKNEDITDFPVAVLWVPSTVVKINNDEVEVLKGAVDDRVRQVISDLTSNKNVEFDIRFQPSTSKEEYLKNAHSLIEQIRLGNIYEVNYCQQYIARNLIDFNSVDAYNRLNKITNAPFSAFIEFDEYSVMSGSPERFIRKCGTKLSSEPIKGTIRRGSNIEEDNNLVEQLQNDPKERSENVMIVDLVRNDLSKIAKRGSVRVDELFKVYTYKTVHQLISKISCEIKEEISFGDILRALFPMGSMTGAPKISAMNLIEEHETFSRGLYAGSVGYIKPNGDFDLNVVIRSLIYNKDKKVLTCSVGGALTIQANPEQEYEECSVKIGKILKSFEAGY